MRKVVVVTNVPSPYRVDLFYYLQTQVKEYNFYVVYTNQSESDRNWTVQNEKLKNSIVLKSKVLKMKGKPYDRYIHFPPNLGKILDKIKPDALIAFEYNPAALQGLMWCRVHKIPFIHLTDGTLYSERNIGMIQKLSRKAIIKGADACIASSTKAREKLLAYGFNEEKIFLSFLTVNAKPYQRNLRKAIQGRLLYVGRICEGKGIDLLFEALHKMNGDYSLHIVGSGESEQIENLKRLANELELGYRVVWCGYKEGEALVNEYMEASAFVLPTREDCFGLVLLEALFSGVPVVSSMYADGAYDLIEHGVNGLIIDPYDSQEFAKAICTVVEDKSYFKHAMHFDAQKFYFENVSKGYVKALDSVLK